VAIVSLAICLRRGLTLALAREAVIRLLTDQPEVTEELGITGERRAWEIPETAAAGFVNRSRVLVLAVFTDDHPRAPTKFQRIGAVYDLSTVFHSR
jgi:hypothetical protein